MERAALTRSQSAYDLRDYSDPEFVNEEELSFDVEFISEDNNDAGNSGQKNKRKRKRLPTLRDYADFAAKKPAVNSVKRN